MEETEYLQEYKLETSIESKNIPKQNTILDACDNEFDNNNNILHFYQQFRESISSNLKKTGYRIGDYELLQDEIITPTFEEVIILWCLDKVQPNLSRKVKIAFNDKLNEGISIHEFKNEIFHHFSGNYLLEEKKQKSVNGSKCNVCDRPFITKSDPDLSNIDPSTLIKEEDIEIHVNSIQDSIKGEEHFQELLEENGEIDNLELNGDISENEENLDNDDESNDATWVADALEKYEAGEGDKPKIKMKKRSGPFGKYNMPIKCDLCDTYYAGKRRLKEHMERKHEKYFKCKKCGESCFGIENLRKHREEVHQQAPKKTRGRKPGDKLTEVVCDTCGKSFTGTKKLQDHIERKHNANFECKTCEETFNNHDELKNHKIKNHKQVSKNEMCPHCGKIIRQDGMKRHILTHISDISCKLCHMKFLTNEELDEHMRKHEENPNYRLLKKKTIHCDTCKRAFVDAEDYGHHICKHYGCDQCPERFMIKKNLDKHKRYHAGEPIFSCELCEALFTNRKALYCHNRAAHDPDKKKHQCDQCPRAFLSKCHLERHKLSHSEVKGFKCEVCHKGFKQKLGLSNHMAIHTGINPFPCVSCDKRFRTSIQMKQHRESGKCSMKMEAVVSTKIES